MAPGGAPASQLICRIRPCDKPAPSVLVSEAEARIQVLSDRPERGAAAIHLGFDRILAYKGAPGEQEQLFEFLRPALLACLKGACCTVLAHGGLQSGKSYSLSGFFTEQQQWGVVPRAIELFGQAMGQDGQAVVEASFFEIQQDIAYDLLRPGYPKVAVREVPQPAFVAIDSGLQANRCEGSTGYNRLLDTYFTGLEQKRKGATTCFQLAILHSDGRGSQQQRSYLRFLEVAWPRPQAASAGAAKPAGVSPSQGPVQGRAAAALEQALQSKLSGGEGSSSSAYGASPIALLLKPCIEGDNLLYFIQCMRIEQIQLPCLSVVAPLLHALRAWLATTRAAAARGAPASEALSSAPSRRTPPGVPPLRFDGRGGGDAGMDLDLTTASVATALGVCGTSPVPAVAMGPPMLPAAALMKPPVVIAPPPEEAGGHADPPPDSEDRVQDMCAAHHCSELLEVKYRSMELLRADAAQSAKVLQELGILLVQSRASRAAQDDDGPNERETNLKLLHEKVYRSLRRTAAGLKEQHSDVRELSRFCGGGVNMDSTGDQRAEDELEQMLDQVAAQHGVEHGTPEPHAQAKQPLQAPNQPMAGNRGAGVVVPQLPLELLPQEHPPAEAMAQFDGTRSPGSASSGSSEASPVRQLAGTVAWHGVPPVKVRAPVQASSGKGMFVVSPPPHALQGHASSLATLPQTPPISSSTPQAGGAVFVGAGNYDQGWLQRASLTSAGIRHGTPILASSASAAHLPGTREAGVEEDATGHVRRGSPAAGTMVMRSQSTAAFRLQGHGSPGAGYRLPLGGATSPQPPWRTTGATSPQPQIPWRTTGSSITTAPPMQGAAVAKSAAAGAAGVRAPAPWSMAAGATRAVTPAARRATTVTAAAPPGAVACGASPVMMHRTASTQALRMAPPRVARSPSPQPLGQSVVAPSPMCVG